jgi:hypothetical protein
VPNRPHGRSLFRGVFLKTPAFKKASAWWTDGIEKRYPHEEQGDDGDCNEEGNDFVRHGIVSEASQRGDLTMGKWHSLNRAEGAGSHQKSSESMVRLGEIMLIRALGPGVRRARRTAQTKTVWHRSRLPSVCLRTVVYEMREGCSAGGAGLGLRLRTKLRRLRRLSEAWSIFFQKPMK